MNTIRRELKASAADCFPAAGGRGDLEAAAPAHLDQMMYAVRGRCTRASIQTGEEKRHARIKAGARR